MRILGIETSCDETSAAVVEDGISILSNVIASQVDLHQKYGGVVPEVASRKHVELLIPTIQEALEQANSALDEIDAVAVINRPGLIGALIVGVAGAKAIALARGLPLVGVHHLEAHIYANFLASTGADSKLPISDCGLANADALSAGICNIQSAICNSNPVSSQFPFICLIVSGGHSDIVYATAHGEYEVMARTRDDAAGECFDKCARAMGLGYPGGPIIDRLARDGDPKAVRFPRAKMEGSLDFSFSGLKTSVIRFAQKSGADVRLEDMAASLQEALVDALVGNTIRAAEMKQANRILLAGGVAANSRLRAEMEKRAASRGIAVRYPPPVLCTDNAAMAAGAGYFRLTEFGPDDLAMDAYATEPLTGAGRR